MPARYYDCPNCYTSLGRRNAHHGCNNAKLIEGLERAVEASRARVTELEAEVEERKKNHSRVVQEREELRQRWSNCVVSNTSLATESEERRSILRRAVVVECVACGAPCSRSDVFDDGGCRYCGHPAQTGLEARA